jgi:ABC transport system ATP-binding/permease protein
MPSLTIMTGEQTGKQFVVGSRTLSIGRDPARDVQVIDPKVSRKHALLRCDAGRYVLVSAKSLNGMTVNGRPVEEEHPLQGGETITMGDTVLKFELDMDPDRSNALNNYKRADRQTRDSHTVM